jgi:hypothetical protein
MVGRDAIRSGIEGRLFRLALGGLLFSLLAIKGIEWWHSKHARSPVIGNPNPADDISAGN